MQRGAAQGNGWTYFISHKQDDSKTEALELTVQLGKGACWLDVHQRDAGRKAMENGVRNSQFFVCILSPGYLESEWCMAELEWAFKFSKPIILCFRAVDNVGALLQRLPSEFASVSNIQGIKLDRSHPDFFQVAINMIHERVGDATGNSDGISKVRRGKGAIEHWKTMRTTVFTVVAARRFREGGKEHHPSNHELDVLPDIALRKLENPQLQLNADQQLEVLEACIAAGKQQAVRATDKQLVMVIGNTGAGKSTLVNYLHGCQMELHKTTDDKGKKKKVIRVREDSSPPELMVIGHTNKSATFMPKVDGGDDTLTFANCPGFLDNRGAEINIANAVNIKAAVSQAAGIRVLIVLNYYSLKADRGRGIRELAQILADLFGDARRMGEHAGSVVLGLSQAPRRDEDDDEPMQLSDFQDRVSDTTGLGDDAAAIVKSLVSRMFVYDPLNRGDETWSVCDQILASLRSLPPIAEPGDVFRTVLTAEDERALRACVSEMSMRLRKGMERKEYDMVGTMLRQLSALEGIGNPLVTRMLAYAREQVALASVMLKDDAIRCAMTRGFDEADEGVRELKRAASALSKAGQATRDLARRVLKMSEDASAAVSRLKDDEEERRQMRDRHDALQRQVEFLEAKAREDRERADAHRAELENERADNERKRKEMAEAFEAERKKLQERMAESNEAEVRKKMQEELKRLETERDAQEREARETFEKREKQLREQAEASARRAAEAEKERQSLMSAAKKEQEQEATPPNPSHITPMAAQQEYDKGATVSMQEKQEAHLYTIIKVAMDRDIKAQIGTGFEDRTAAALAAGGGSNDMSADVSPGANNNSSRAIVSNPTTPASHTNEYFDLVDHEKVRHFRVQKQMTFNDFKQMVEKEMSIPVECQRYWMWAKRQNQTYRPSRPLTHEEESMAVALIRDSGTPRHEKTASGDLKLFLETPALVFGNSLHKGLPPPMREPLHTIVHDVANKRMEHLLFFKLYDPYTEMFTYVGRAFAHRDRPMSDLLPALWTFAGYPHGTPLLLFEEVKYEPVMIEEITLTQTLSEAQLEDGDIICYQRVPEVSTEETAASAGGAEVVMRDAAALSDKAAAADGHPRYDTVVKFLEYVRNRQFSDLVNGTTNTSTRENDTIKYANDAIHKLIANKMWSEVKACLSAYPGKAREKDNNRLLPLHLAAICRAPADVVRMLLDAYPAGAREKDKYGYLPLHSAAWFKAPADVVRMLLDAYAEGARGKSNDGSLPLHYAVRNNAPADVVRMLLDAYAEGATTVGKDKDGDLPLHHAVRNNAPADVVRMLLEAYPEGKMVKSNYGRSGHGQLPVHVAKNRGAPQEIMKLLDVPLGSSWFS
ncbi:ubiquitin carboxyl-terminal hydrolase [Pycnococcus provasolii]